MRVAAPFAIAAALVAWLARVPDVGPWTLGDLVPRLGLPSLAALTGAAISAVFTAGHPRGRGAALGALLGVACSLALFQLFDLDVPRRRGVLMAAGSSAAVTGLTAWLARAGGVTRAAAVAGLGLAALAGMRAADHGPVRSELPPLEAAPNPLPAEAPDIVLLTLDTTRFDAMGFNQLAESDDQARSTTPHLDQLSTLGVLFTDATATAPHTHPSMASMLTGLDPAVHGSVSGAPMLARDVATLAEHLRAQGYATAGFLDNPWLGETFGLARGYEHLEMNARPERVISWLEEPRDQPVFLHVHFFQPHGPYERRDVEALGGPRAKATTRARIGDRFDANWIRDGEVPGSHGLTPEEVDWLRELYHSEVRAMDADIGVVLEQLTKRPRSLMIAVAADHGEEFDERGSLHHSHTVHQELVHVPLLIYGPGGRAHGPFRVDEPVGLVDLAPTILDLAGLAPLPNVGTGVSLAPLMGADRNGTGANPTLRAPRLIVSQRERHAGGRRLLAARLGSWKLHVRTPPAEAGAALAPDEELDLMLYRLDLDPSESSDVTADHPEKVRELLGALRQWDTRTRDQAARFGSGSSEGPIPAGVDADLRALGYGGGR